MRLRARALAAPRRLAAAALGGARKGRRRRGRGGTTVARLQATLAAQPCTHAARLPQPHLLRPLLPVLAAHAAIALCVSGGPCPWSEDFSEAPRSKNEFVGRGQKKIEFAPHYTGRQYNAARGTAQRGARAHRVDQRHLRHLQLPRLCRAAPARARGRAHDARVRQRRLPLAERALGPRQGALRRRLLQPPRRDARVPGQRMCTRTPDASTADARTAWHRTACRMRVPAGWPWARTLTRVCACGCSTRPT